MNIPRVAFVLYQYPLGVSSMIINSIRLFARNGYAVDVFIDKQTEISSPMVFQEPGIAVHARVGDDSLLLRGCQLLLTRAADFLSPCERLAYKLQIATAVGFFYPRLNRFADWLNKELGNHDYRFIIPVESRSLLCLRNYLYPERVIYYNMELLDWSRDNPLYQNKRILKIMEHRMIKMIHHVVIQSPQRAVIFADINNFDPNKISVLPVAAMGEPVYKKQDFFRERFGLTADTVIVVYAGNFLPWAQCIEIIESVAGWPVGFALVMQTWNHQARKTSYFREMRRKAIGLPVHFSFEYIPYDQLALLLSSADIGVMFYEPIDDNFTEILFSSNKLAEYLKAGLPVACSDFPSLRDFVTSRGIGATVGSPIGLPQALAWIAQRLEVFRSNALDCYQKEFRFERYFENFLNRLAAE